MMFADLLLNRPINLPDGKTRSVSFETPVERLDPNAGLSMEELCRVNTEKVFKAIKKGAEKRREIRDKAGLSQITTDRALKELIEAGRVHRVAYNRTFYYAVAGKSPVFDCGENTRRQETIKAIKKNGGSATAVQLMTRLGLSETGVKLRLKRLMESGDVIKTPGSRGYNYVLKK